MVNYNIGELYRESNEISTAIEYFNNSLTMAKSTGQVDFIGSNYEALIHCYASTCDYENFENCFRMFTIGKDSLIEKLNEFEMTEIEIKYKVEESIHESIQLQKENTEKEYQLRKYKFLLTGLAAIAIILLFIYLLFLKIRKK